MQQMVLSEETTARLIRLSGPERPLCGQFGPLGFWIDLDDPRMPWVKQQIEAWKKEEA